MVVLSEYMQNGEINCWNIEGQLSVNGRHSVGRFKMTLLQCLLNNFGTLSNIYFFLLSLSFLIYKIGK